MNSSDKLRFSSILLQIAETYEKQLSREVIEIYWQICQDWSFDQFNDALRRHVENPDRGVFFPKPADLIAAKNGKNKSSLHAWVQVTRAMFLYGRYQTVKFEDRTINRVISDMGGWPWICDQNLNEPWTQKEFERRYLEAGHYSDDFDEPLHGLIELDNRERGYLEEIPDTIMISAGGKEIGRLAPPERKLLEAERKEK